MYLPTKPLPPNPENGALRIEVCVLGNTKSHTEEIEAMFKACGFRLWSTREEINVEHGAVSFVEYLWVFEQVLDAKPAVESRPKRPDEARFPAYFVDERGYGETKIRIEVVAKPYGQERRAQLAEFENQGFVYAGSKQNRCPGCPLILIFERTRGEPTEEEPEKPWTWNDVRAWFEKHADITKTDNLLIHARNFLGEAGYRVWQSEDNGYCWACSTLVMKHQPTLAAATMRALKHWELLQTLDKRGPEQQGGG